MCYPHRVLTNVTLLDFRAANARALHPTSKLRTPLSWPRRNAMPRQVLTPLTPSTTPTALTACGRTTTWTTMTGRSIRNASKLAWTRRTR
eukprot:2256919-Pleurochrysis_carterae.AAC.1